MCIGILLKPILTDITPEEWETTLEQSERLYF